MSCYLLVHLQKTVVLQERLYREKDLILSLDYLQAVNLLLLLKRYQKKKTAEAVFY